MTQVKSTFRTFEEYATLDPFELPGGNDELVDGVYLRAPKAFYNTYHNSPQPEIGYISSKDGQFYRIKMDSFT